MPALRKVGEYESPCWYDDQVSFVPEMDSLRRICQPYPSYIQHYSCKQELELQYNMPHSPYLQLPQLESSTVPQSSASANCNPLIAYCYDRTNGSTLQSSAPRQEEQIQQSHEQNLSSFYNSNHEQAVDQVTDWRVLDKFVASQLSHEDASKESKFSNAVNFHVSEQMNVLANESRRPEIEPEYATTSVSSCQIDQRSNATLKHRRKKPLVSGSSQVSTESNITIERRKANRVQSVELQELDSRNRHMSYV